MAEAGASTPRASRIEQIEDVINRIISTAEGEPLFEGQENISYREIRDVEVPPGEFPASTLLFSYPAQEDAGTGGLTGNTWRWIQRSYFDFTDPEAAQKEMKRLLPALLTSLRHAGPDDLVLPDGTPVELVVEDGGDPDRGAVGQQQMLIKSLYLTATTEEV